MQNGRAGAWDGSAEPVVRDQILARTGTGKKHFRTPCLADHEQDWQPYPVDLPVINFKRMATHRLEIRNPSVQLCTYFRITFGPGRSLRLKSRSCRPRRTCLPRNCCRHAWYSHGPVLVHGRVAVKEIQLVIMLSEQHFFLLRTYLLILGIERNRNAGFILVYYNTVRHRVYTGESTKRFVTQ